MTSPFGPIVDVHNGSGSPDLVLVCEHASHRVPVSLGGLGLDDVARTSHIAWDPGAMGVAERMSGLLDAPLVHGRISRLIYDCNRSPEAVDAIPVRAESVEVPGNRDLPADARAARVACVYRPFEATVRRLVAEGPATALVTIHTFTPVWHGRPRSVEIGILHGRDPRLATAMYEVAASRSDLDVRLNEPYGTEDGVTHTIDLHGAANGLLNVMLEIRNDLVATPDEQARMGDLLTGWLRAALALVHPARAIA